MLAEYTREALQLLAKGEIRLGITGVLPLDEAAQAHVALESGGSTGKLLLRVGG
ncbi:zinc-binding dehydrogenase [Streptomyces sp. NBC_01262]|uniref:zinc-binding dehydrogenase n=1 Tax=Streptomyces sp. NBC_01262 TaxID=2903803 RepID=UPI002E34AB13|nr:zinc-binding dehydrogenase [Streptomyces sp. NBC_01262]